jgi:poly(3-hydroxybutyrate) depolymerase
MNRDLLRNLTLLLLLGVLHGPLAAAAAEPLPAYGADLSQTTVSGVSAGAFMAVQFHVAHSSMVIGAGVIAGGPFGCAEGSLRTALRRCVRQQSEMSAEEVSRLKATAEALAREAKIDSTTELAKSRVWTFSGTQDPFVSPAIVSAVGSFYAGYVDAQRLRHVGTIPATHAMVTRGYGAACSTMERPFINDCDFDAAGELLAYLLGPLQPPSAQEEGALIAFDQNEFADASAYRYSMAEHGYAYVPQRCASARCRVHVAFHGCLQHAEATGDVFVRHAGYNRWADTNNLIVLYPQLTSRWGWNPKRGSGFVFNPMACWDWWGYTGTEYDTQAGSQIKAVRDMLQRLASPRPQRTSRD